jgi:methionyl-tRNA formyltransferase
MLEQIIEFDSNLLNELDEQKQNIEVKKAEQEKKKTDLRVAKVKQGQMQILMENQKTLQVSYASKLSEEEKNLYEQIEQYKKEQEDLENQIQAAINWSGALAIQYKGGDMETLVFCALFVVLGVALRLMVPGMKCHSQNGLKPLIYWQSHVAATSMKGPHGQILASKTTCPSSSIYY